MSPRPKQRRVRPSRFQLDDLTECLRLSQELQAITRDTTPPTPPNDILVTPRFDSRFFTSMPNTSSNYQPRPKPFRGVPYTRSQLSNPPIYPPLGSPIHLHPCPPALQARGMRSSSSTSPSASTSASTSTSTSVSTSPTTPTSSAPSWSPTPLYAPQPRYASNVPTILSRPKRARTEKFDPNSIVARPPDVPPMPMIHMGNDSSSRLDPYGMSCGYSTSSTSWQNGMPTVKP